MQNDPPPPHLTLVASHACFGGRQEYYSHRSTHTQTEMTFGVFLPPQAGNGNKVPALYFLAGLTCTWETAAIKAGAQRTCAELGIALITPDTSPRGPGVPDDPAGDYDLGLGAGFYVDASQSPWSANYAMNSYIVALTAELPINLDLAPGRIGIMGHSMGGHGALTIALTQPGRFRSISAFAPICAPTQVPWGRKAFSAYLGSDETLWRRHDAVALIEDGARVPDLLVDQGLADKFLDDQLKPRLLEQACRDAGIPHQLRMHAGYDHSYYFISTFMADHVAWHAERLRG